MPSQPAAAAAPPPPPRRLWLAMGVIVTQWRPQFRRRSAGVAGVEWRYVTTDRSLLGDPAHVVVRCPDVFYRNATADRTGRDKLRMGFQFSCFCKTVEWFRRSLVLFPTAAFVGKTKVGHPGGPWDESNKSFGHGFASSPSDAAIKASPRCVLWRSPDRPINQLVNQPANQPTN